MAETVHLGISTCPNDTFAFHAIISRAIDLRGLMFRIELLDVQQLNDRLMLGDFDVAKASFHAALFLSESTVVLPSGSALGFDNGPLLLSRHADMSPADFSDRGQIPIVLCPGQTTTATLLYRLFYDQPCEMRQIVFSEIMPALIEKKADFGVCIHEGRFTWQQKGLHRVADLGETWNQKTSQPLPLGGILARRKLGSSLIGRIQSVIRDSIQYAIDNRSNALPTMRRYAAEMDDQVLMAHVDLYVNEQTVDLGTIGQTALAKLSELASAVSPSEATRTFHPIQVFQPS